MTTILVSGASGVVGYGILRSFRMTTRRLKLIGTTMHENSAALAFCDLLEKAPHTTDPCYYDWLVGVVRKHGIDLIVPGIEIDMFSWSSHRPRLESVVKFALNAERLISICCDKWIFYKDLLKKSEPTLIPTYDHGDFDELADKCGLPFLLKPRQGYGSKGLVKVKNQSVFRIHHNRIGSELIAQPIVGSDESEYSISCFGDGHGEFVNMFSLRRKLGTGGFTEWAEVVDNEPFIEAVRRYCGFYQPLGPTNFQFRVHNGNLKLLEINPRISSASSIRAAFGYNEAEMALGYFFEGRLPAVPLTERGQAVRYVEDHIIRE